MTWWLREMRRRRSPKIGLDLAIRLLSKSMASYSPPTNLPFQCRSNSLESENVEEIAQRFWKWSKIILQPIRTNKPLDESSQPRISHMKFGQLPRRLWWFPSPEAEGSSIWISINHLNHFECCISLCFSDCTYLLVVRSFGASVPASDVG